MPSVKVPVLSKTIVSIWFNFSKASPDFIKIPNSAPLPVPTIIAVGVASPNEQGHAIISIDIKIVNTNSNGFWFTDTTLYFIKNHQSKAAKMAMKITVGTNIKETLSASLAIGAFVICASSTSFAIFDISVSPSVAFTVTFNAPSLFILPLYTLSFSDFSTGILSPVIIASSIVECPSIITPSTGIFSPGFIKTVSPFDTSSIPISIISPFLIILAFLAWKFTNFFIAAEALPLLKVSKYFPNITKAIIIAADS